MTREKELRGFNLLHSFSRRSQCLIIFYISQNTTALLKKARVIFRTLGLFFCTQRFSPGLQKEGQLESLGFKFVLSGQCFLESCGGFATAPVPPVGCGTSSRGVGCAGSPHCRNLAGPGLEREPWSTVLQVPAWQPQQLGYVFGW